MVSRTLLAELWLMVSGEDCMREVAAMLPVPVVAVCFGQKLRVKRAAMIFQGNHFSPLP